MLLSLGSILETQSIPNISKRFIHLFFHFSLFCSACSLNKQTQSKDRKGEESQGEGIHGFGPLQKKQRNNAFLKRMSWPPPEPNQVHLYSTQIINSVANRNEIRRLKSGMPSPYLSPIEIQTDPTMLQH